MRLLILLALLGGTMWLIRQGVRDARRQRPDKPSQGGEADAHLVQDPICKSYIPLNTAVPLTIGKETHYFCSDRCASVYRDEHQ